MFLLFDIKLGSRLFVKREVVGRQTAGNSQVYKFDQKAEFRAKREIIQRKVILFDYFTDCIH